MLDILEKELAIHHIRLRGRNACDCKGDRISVLSCIKMHDQSAQENKKILLKLWSELCSLLEKESQTEANSCEELSPIFTHSIKGLYKLASKFSFLRDNGTVVCLKESIDRDISSFSGLIMGKVIDYKLSIEWVHHLVRSDLYICALMKKYRMAVRHKSVVVARGVQGPWSHLDLPMLERWFEWEDVEEETSGRGQDKRHQRRYKMPLENYGEGDSSPNEGFYWREIRNEPYAFDDEDETLYPHRNQLWR